MVNTDMANVEGAIPENMITTDDMVQAALLPFRCAPGLAPLEVIIRNGPPVLKEA